ncbi:hypothetical protein DE146DRAFT_665838 [Phaeosphaeria sp. MPI-PUGE-AT-0046c]|nr:hypothetical protein DE146DRAFT_665838 [Phaeosphaeria sp. MPI-PUGE-AT-0046c]
MSACERVSIHRSPEYKHNGAKSCVFAMSKYGFDSTKPGLYLDAKRFHAQGKFGGAVGGRMRTQHVLKKRHHHHQPSSQCTIVFVEVLEGHNQRLYRAHAFAARRSINITYTKPRSTSPRTNCTSYTIQHPSINDSYGMTQILHVLRPRAVPCESLPACLKTPMTQFLILQPWLATYLPPPTCRLAGSRNRPISYPANSTHCLGHKT